jgi:hypothetical protein
MSVACSTSNQWDIQGKRLLMSEAEWRPDPHDPRQMRWWDGQRWHDLTVPNQEELQKQNRTIREGRSSALVTLKSISLGAWTATGFAVYLVTALLIAAEITAQEGTSFGMNLLVSLVGLALLLVVFVFPALLVAGFILWWIYTLVREETGGWDQWVETRKANRAARKAGLPTTRQAQKIKLRSERVEKARSTLR